MTGIVCEIQSLGNSFILTWLSICVMTAFSVFGGSGLTFYRYYVNPTYDQWRWKTNPKYPKPEKIRQEIRQTVKGLLTAAFCPALSLYLAHSYRESGLFKSYCGVGPHGWGYLLFSFLVVVFATDLYEFLYHYCGHIVPFMWAEHKHHHQYPNPSPFAVIADEPVDQFMRALPLVLFPMIMPINMDLLFFTYSVFFYAHGIYQHWGYELNWPDAHHPFLNDGYHHHLHHARSLPGKPMHCCFMFKWWDELCGSVYKGPCGCVKCAQKQGKRDVEDFKKVEIPDYSVLLSPRFMMD